MGSHDSTHYYNCYYTITISSLMSTRVWPKSTLVANGYHTGGVTWLASVHDFDTNTNISLFKIFLLATSVPQCLQGINNTLLMMMMSSTFYQDTIIDNNKAQPLLQSWIKSSKLKSHYSGFVQVFIINFHSKRIIHSIKLILSPW